MPFFGYIYYYYTNDVLFPTYFLLKFFSFIYYYQFNHLYPYPNQTKWKHLIRLTDTGHIANFLYYFFPKTFSGISHNILFVISFAYYFCTFFLGMKDVDTINNKQILSWVYEMHSHINHILPYSIVFLDMLIQGQWYKSSFYTHDQYCYFDHNNLLYTYIWLYSWFLFIYLPWRFKTNDPVYSVLSQETPWKIKIGVFVFVHLLAYLGNTVGRFLQNC